MKQRRLQPEDRGGQVVPRPVPVTISRGQQLIAGGVQVSVRQPLRCPPAQRADLAEGSPLRLRDFGREPQRGRGVHEKGVECWPLPRQAHPKARPADDHVVRAGPQPAGGDQPGHEPVHRAVHRQLLLQRQRGERLRLADVRAEPARAPQHLVVRALADVPQVVLIGSDKIELGGGELVGSHHRSPRPSARSRAPSSSIAVTARAYSSASQPLARWR